MIQSSNIAAIKSELQLINSCDFKCPLTTVLTACRFHKIVENNLTTLKESLGNHEIWNCLDELADKFANTRDEKALQTSMTVKHTIKHKTNIYHQVLSNKGIMNLILGKFEFVSKVCPFSPAMKEKHYIPKELRTLELVSRKFSELAAIELTNRRSQYKLLNNELNAIETKGIKHARDAVDHMIENKFKLANLKNLKDLSSELLEELFEKNPFIEHLILNFKNKNIKKIPLICNRIITLDISGLNTEELPPEMPNLTHLNGALSSPLKKLPLIPNIKHLNIDYAKISNLPENMPNIVMLSFSNSEIHELHKDLPELIKLKCTQSKITKLTGNFPKLTNLTSSLNIENINIYAPNLSEIEFYTPQYKKKDCRNLFTKPIDTHQD